jgi:hypothetical protein
MSSWLCKWFGWWCVSAPVVNPPVVVPPVVVNPPTNVVSLESIVNANGCKDIYWKDRGKAPIGFVLGMAKAYVQTKCDKDLLGRLTKAPHSKEDAYVRYGLSPTLPNIYTLMIGLGMREASGRWCCGRDMSAGWSESDTAEAGVYQSSYNSNAFSPYLKTFFKTFNKQCFLEDFKKGATCKSGDLKNWGNKAEGLAFQEKSKKCPAFATEYTALLLKETYRHHGPLVRKEVQFVNSCKELFEKIDAVTVCK